MPIFFDRLGTEYGIREGWPWIIIVLGIGGILQQRRSFSAWITAVLGVFIIGSKYYSIHVSVPSIIKTFFLPIILIVIALLWLWRHEKD